MPVDIASIPAVNDANNNEVLMLILLVCRTNLRRNWPNCDGTIVNFAQDRRAFLKAETLRKVTNWGKVAGGTQRAEISQLKRKPTSASIRGPTFYVAPPRRVRLDAPACFGILAGSFASV
ncbi:MAG: hypothetical protein Kow0040_07620 [Thermogutta sp.]